MKNINMDNFKEIRKLDVSIEEWNKIAGHITSICSDNWNFENSKNKGDFHERKHSFRECAEGYN